MWTQRFVKFAPATGIVFVILSVLGFIVSENGSPDFVAPGDDWSAYFTAHDSAITWGGIVTMLSVFFFLWFLGSLTSTLSAAEGGDRRVTSIARAGGVVGGTMVLLSGAILTVGGFRVDDQKSIDGVLASAYGDLSTAMGFIAAPIGFAVLAGATAVVALRTGVLPMWLAWVSVVVAVGMLVPFISWALLLVFPLWVLIISILLLLRSAGPIETERD
jgi:hypothetical protein